MNFYHLYKFLIFGVNFSLLTLSVSLTGYGSWLIVNRNVILADAGSVIKGAGAASAALGALTSATLFIGCIGAICNSRCCLALYSIISFILLGHGIGACTFGILGQHRFSTALRDIMKAEVGEVVGNSSVLIFANLKFDCCGIDDMEFCDQSYPPYDLCSFQSKNCQMGCLEPVWKNLVEPYLTITIGLLVVLCVLIAISVFLSLCLCVVLIRKDRLIRRSIASKSSISSKESMRLRNTTSS